MEEKKEKSKIYSLSEAEFSNVNNRAQLLEQRNYEVRLIRADLDSYVLHVVCPRLGIDPKAKVRLSADLKGIEVIPDDAGDGKDKGSSESGPKLS